MTRTSRTFRIFVSSTFSDLKAERTALQEKVFPRLRELAALHGCRFQAIDLRWGVSAEAALDQQTMRICLGEIRRCQKTSPRPNFILLLGDRYGWCPLPAEIIQEEFQKILPVIPAEEKPLFSEWYRCDENAVPPTYYLQPRSGPYVADDTWEQVEHRLRQMFLAAVEKISLSPESLLKFVASATEQEIEAGALQIPDAPQHVFGFFRQIEDIPPASGPFGEANPVIARKQAQLKLRLKKRLSGNIHEYTARWQGESPSLTHLDQLCEDVFTTLSQVMLSEIGQMKAVNPSQREVDAHHEFALDRAKMFVGREALRTQIAEYLAGGDHMTLSISGEPGSGISTLMARAVQDAQAKKGDQAVLIVRFIGATPDSTNGRALLEGLCRQISLAYDGGERTTPSEYRDLVQEFAKRLRSASAKKPLVIFLDALDQLSDSDNARNLAWLPAELPPNVKIVVSTIPGECLQALERRLTLQNRLAIAPMTEEEGGILLTQWLQEARRRLKPDQEAYLLKKFNAAGLPLYLKLAFEEALQWKSYDPPPSLSEDIPGFLRNLVKRLSMESNHGPMLVSRSLGYLAAAKNGLSEDELLEILWMDADVRKNFFDRSPKSPQDIRSLPVVIWSRIYFDLEPYIAERNVNGISLLSFHHRQLRKIMLEEYVGQLELKQRHRALAAYFRKQSDPTADGTWRNISEHPLGELSYQLANAGEEEKRQLIGLFTDPVYLNARTLVCDIWQLIDEYAHLDLDPESAAGDYRGFLAKHAQTLSLHEGQLIPLLHHEGFPLARIQLEKTEGIKRIILPWLRTERNREASDPTSEISGVRTPRIEMVSTWEFPVSCAVDFADQKKLAFHVLRLGTIGIVDIERACPLNQVIPIRETRPLSLFSSRDGLYLAIVFEDGNAVILELQWNGLEVVNQRVVTTIRFLLPEFENPVMCWQTHSLLYQTEDGPLARLDLPSGASSLLLSAEGTNSPLELRSIAAEDDRVFFAMSSGQAVRLFYDAGGKTRLISQVLKSEVIAVSFYGISKAAAAFSNREVRVFDLAVENDVFAQTTVNEDPTSLTHQDGALIIATKTDSYYAWTMDQGNPPVSIREGHLKIISRQVKRLASAGEGLFFALSQSSVSILRMGVGESGKASTVLGLYQSPHHSYSIHQKGKSITLVNWISGQELTLVEQTHAINRFCIDGLGNFLYACTDGTGSILDGASGSLIRVNAIPITMAAIAGDPAGGFWIADRLGDIHRIEPNGVTQKAYSVSMTESRVLDLLCTGKALVWRGWCTPQTGPDEGRPDTLLLFTIDGSRGLHDAGRRIFEKPDGFLETFSYNDLDDTLIIIVDNSARCAREVKIGSIADFLEGREINEPIDWVGSPVNTIRIGLDSYLYLLCEDGSIYCIDPQRWTRKSVLTPSVPIKKMAEGWGRQERILLADEQAVLYSCTLENG